MNTNKKTARIVGVLFITAMVTYFLGMEIFLGPILNAPDFLINVSANSTQVIIGVFLELINCAVVVGIGVVMFPILKQHNETIALGHVGARIIESALLIVSAIVPLSLITLSQEYVQAGAPDASYFQALGALSVAERYLAYRMAMIALGLGGLMFCYLLYQSKLIPRFISVWGLIGYAGLLTAMITEIFDPSLDYTVPFIFLTCYLPTTLFETLLLPIWLIVKGFNPSAIAAESAKQI